MTGRATSNRVQYQIARCEGGWNVHGRVSHWRSIEWAAGELVFECGHLHPTRAGALACKTEQERATRQ